MTAIITKTANLYLLVLGALPIIALGLVHAG
jgi:hypothetical protein